MRLSGIKGNVDVVKALSGMVESGRVPHAIMFHEDDGGGAFPIAMAFLDRLYGGNPRIGKLIHPDLHFIFPTSAGSISEQYLDSFRSLALEKPSFTESELSSVLGIEGKNSMIAVSEAKHLLEVLSLSALEGGYRSVVIYLPEKMNQEAANRLLKLIEEPPAQTQFLLVTHAPEKVLVTISSRCQRIRINPVQCQDVFRDYSDSGLLEELMSSLLAHNLSEALDAGDRIAALPSRDSIKLFCKFAAERMRGIFLCQQSLHALYQGESVVETWAARCRKTFPRQAMEAFGRVSAMVDSNVNVKIVFTDLVNRLYSSI